MCRARERRASTVLVPFEAETIIGGTGPFAGETGSGSGTVKLHGGVAIGKTSGTITLR